MNYENITLGKNIQIDPSSSFNNISMGDNVKISKNCTLFGGPDYILQIGRNSYMGMNSTIMGYLEKIIIGENVSIAQNVTIMSDSGPNKSERLQRIFPIHKAPVTIGDHSWIGAGVVIMPGVTLGRFCIVAANSFVSRSFSEFTIIGGNPAKVIRSFSEEEINIVLND